MVINDKIFQVIRTPPPANGMNRLGWKRRELDAGGVDSVAIPELRSEGEALREVGECQCRRLCG